MNKVTLAIICLVLLTSCASHTDRILSAESHQAAALHKSVESQVKIDNITKKKFGAIANLTQQVKILLSVPNEDTQKKLQVETQLLDASLSLSGPPSNRESELESEVKNLLDTQDKNEKQIAEITKRGKDIQTDLDKATLENSKLQQQVAKSTQTLYQMAITQGASLDKDEFVKHICIWALVIVVGFILLRIFFTMTKTGATIAAKIP